MLARVSTSQGPWKPGLVGLALALASAGWGPPLAEPPDERRAAPAQAPPDHDAFADPPPRDPDDTPFMAAPHNQLGHWSLGRERPLTRGFQDDHRITLSAVPTYAAIHMAFIGRGAGPLRGGGGALELDVRLLPWLYLRAFGSHTLHPVFEATAFDNDTNAVTLLANGGLVQVTNTGASIVYALDIGRFVPRVDVGGGLMFVRSPPAAQAGQWGAQCSPGDVCDLGLACSLEQRCRPAPFAELHAGIGLDLLLGQRWALGVAVRYYALLQALADLPIYIHGSLRLSARF